MKSKGIGLKDAFQVVKKSIPATKLNAGFFEQLMAFELTLTKAEENSMTLQDWRRSSLKMF